MDFDYKNILIFGYARSGKSVEKVLKDIGVKYKIYDKNIKLTGGQYVWKLNTKTLKQFDLIVISPGVSIYNKYVKLADRLGIKIISELEFGFWFTSAEIIAVTGTNGKTTTTKLINKVMQYAGYKCDVYGNIGRPLSDAYKKDYDYIICEVSSFQLEATDKFVSRIGVLLNIAEDHIDRHKTFNNYIECKKFLFKNNSNTNYVVIGNNTYINDIIAPNIVGKVLYFGQESGIYCKENKVYKNDKKLIEINKKLKSYTYVDNILAVICVMDILGIPYDIINKIELENECEHRLETFYTRSGITFINDSKATNPHSTITALNNVKGNVILLLGGSDKNNSFDELVSGLRDNIAICILFGDMGKKLIKVFKKYDKKFAYFKTLKLATEYALSIASKGDTVLLSPACASFDEFSGYEERGVFFKKLVKESFGEYDKNKK